MMNRTLYFTLALALAAASSPLAAHAAAVQTDPTPAAQAAPSPAATPEDKLYDTGTKAMDEQRWADAVTAFDQVAAAKGKRADAALYWKAYALAKLDRKDESRSTCDSLRRNYASSSWNKECIVLRTRTTVIDAEAIAELKNNIHIDVHPDPHPDPQIRIYTKAHGDRLTSEDDIKILALNSLMQQEPEKALPLLKNLILSDQKIELRREALFVLSRSKQPDAQALLMEVTTSTKDPELQRVAIEQLAVGHGKDAGPTLVTIYKNSSDAQVKRAAMNGLFITHDATRLVDLARGEKDLNLKRDIVSQLALMHDPAATAYMEELLK